MGKGRIDMSLLEGKCVVLGVTGGIAAYKMANVASALRKAGAEIHVIMTKNATQFITPLTFETLTGNKCMVDTFDRDFKFEVTHVSLAKKADLILIAPATANVIAKLAHGIADDMLTTTVLASRCPKLMAPAMNTAMLENPITQDNIRTLEHYGFEIIPPDSGMLACRDVGSGKLPAEGVMMDYIYRHLAHEKDMEGLRVTVTAGPTQEPLDPVRYLTNHSSGKMGYALARAAVRRGAQVCLIHGQTALEPVRFARDLPVVTARQMYEAVTGAFEDTDILIMAAAVADYRPAQVADNKIKKKDEDLSIPLARTDDILGSLAPRKTTQFVCGFSMETQDMIENSRKKLEKKHLDMIAANNLKVEGAGFGVDTNVLTLITADETRQLPLMSKDEAADALLDAILKEWAGR
nr:bifunctional phosphopantothenoylcysteine decarboxylase/phosphopantothenate--cysteine ligase CoaBC [Fournierella massiliensis]